MTHEDKEVSIKPFKEYSEFEKMAQQLNKSLQSLIQLRQQESKRNKIFRICKYTFLAIAFIALIIFCWPKIFFMSNKNFVGVVNIDGIIAAESESNADRIIKGLDQAFQSPAKAIILRINSPGGTPVQADRIYREIIRLREFQKKPIIAVIEDLGASGAYYVASATDKIYAAPSSLVGSIGVIYAGFGVDRALEKLGVERRVIQAGQFKDLLDPFRALDPQQRDFMQQIVDQTHEQFIEAVKMGRGDRLKNDPDLFTGLVWTGNQAYSKGLTDGVATFDQIIYQWTKTNDGYVNFTPSLAMWQRVSKRFGVLMGGILGLKLESSPIVASASLR